MKVVLFLISLACVGVSIPEFASAQQANALPVEDTLQIRSFPPLTLFQFSPGGKWLAYVVEDERNHKPLRDGVPSHERGADIWLLNTETGEARNLTGNTGDNRLPKWSPNGHFLAFISDRDGTGQVQLWI